MADQPDVVLSKALVKEGRILAETLDPLMKAAPANGGLAAALLKQGLVTEDIILDIWSKHFNLPKIDLANAVVEKVAIDKVPLKFAEYYYFLPIKFENRKLTIVVSTPCDTRKQDEIRTQLGCQVDMVLARSADISEAIKKWYGLGAGTIEKILETAGKGAEIHQVPAEEKVEEIEKLAENASVVKLVNQILLDAHQKRATDIHIEPYRGKIKIRYRIDGILYNTNLPMEIKKFIMPIVSRIKIMASMNIIERRLPQDGRAIVKIGDETLDLRISSVPISFGESIVVRLLPIGRVFNLEMLGLEEAEVNAFKQLVDKPHGIILITGPTGSGKSTTLYACLNAINTVDRKIITIEDPVEHETEGITQIQVVPSIGLDFARCLRSILRHDPDVIMVGEVRDLETAEIAARVALTGHLVFSTLHTNDSASGITRLIDIGVEPYLVSSSVEAFIAQRLVRTLCSHCKQENKDAPEELKNQITRELGFKSTKTFTIYKGKGCDKCNGTGYWGRIAIFEILLLDDELKKMVMKRVPSGEIKKMAISKGMSTLRQSGWRKVISGLTTPEEVLEVAPDEMSMGDSAVSPPITPNEADDIGKDDTSGELIPEKMPVDCRAFLRLKTKMNIRYRIVKSRSELTQKHLIPEKFTTTKDASAGGLVFTSPEKIPTGMLLDLSIEIPTESHPIECLSRVVRVDSFEASKSYHIAVCFLDLRGIDRAKLSKFVNDEAAEKTTS